MSKIIKTTTAGGVGFLAGLLLERGLESLTGLDFVDGLFAVSGSILAALSVNKELVKAASRNIEQMFGKDPLDHGKRVAPVQRAEPQDCGMAGEGSKDLVCFRLWAF